MTGGGSNLRLRRARSSDREFIAGLADEAFGIYGDYRRLIHEWMEIPGVETTVAEAGDSPVGLTVLALLPNPEAPWGGIADLLAIAVAPCARGQGFGRALLEGAILQSRRAAGEIPLRLLRLTVAEQNAAARRLFERFGFEYIPGEEGLYPLGQRALSMRLRL